MRPCYNGFNGHTKQPASVVTRPSLLRQMYLHENSTPISVVLMQVGNTTVMSICKYGALWWKTAHTVQSLPRSPCSSNCSMLVCSEIQIVQAIKLQIWHPHSVTNTMNHTIYPSANKFGSQAGNKLSTSMTNAVFWDAATCGSCKTRRFGGTCRPYLQGRKIRERSVGSRITDWRRHIPPKRRFLRNPHGAPSQKTAFFIVTAVKTSNTA
jgi:hypothetical protein